MCYLCEEANGETVTCQDSGRMICFDYQPDNVDVLDQAYVTASGDLFCRRCGQQYDQAEDEGDDEYGEDYFPYPEESVAIPLIHATQACVAIVYDWDNDEDDFDDDESDDE